VHERVKALRRLSTLLTTFPWIDGRPREPAWLSAYNRSHLLLMGDITDFSGTPLEKLSGDGMFQHFRPLFKAH